MRWPSDYKLKRKSIICKLCGGNFEGIGNGCKRKYCNKCSLERKTKKRILKKLLPNPIISIKSYLKYGRKLPTGSIGTLSELIVSVDLLKRGFYVFRSMTPNSPCDLIIEKEGWTIRLEVKTGNRSIGASKKIYFGQVRPKYLSRIDSLAVVIPEESLIIYKPKLEDITGYPSERST